MTTSRGRAGFPIGPQPRVWQEYQSPSLLWLAGPPAGRRPRLCDDEAEREAGADHREALPNLQRVLHKLEPEFRRLRRPLVWQRDARRERVRRGRLALGPVGITRGQAERERRRSGTRRRGGVAIRLQVVACASACCVWARTLSSSPRTGTLSSLRGRQPSRR